MNPRTFDAGPLAEVRHEKDGNTSTLVFVRQLRHPPARVWEALTDPAQVRQWAPFDPDGHLGVSGPTTLRMTDGQTVETYPANVRRAEPPSLLEYTWGDDLLQWTLEPTGTGTTLTLRHTVQSPEWLSRTAAGWHICLVVADHLMAGQPIGRIVGAEARNYGWDALNDAYAKRLGIATSGFPSEAFRGDPPR